MWHDPSPPFPKFQSTADLGDNTVEPTQNHCPLKLPNNVLLLLLQLQLQQLLLLLLLLILLLIHSNRSRSLSLASGTWQCIAPVLQEH